MIQNNNESKNKINDTNKNDFLNKFLSPWKLLLNKERTNKSN